MALSMSAAIVNARKESRRLARELTQLCAHEVSYLAAAEAVREGASLAPGASVESAAPAGTAVHLARRPPESPSCVVGAPERMGRDRRVTRASRATVAARCTCSLARGSMCEGGSTPLARAVVAASHTVPAEAAVVPEE